MMNQSNASGFSQLQINALLKLAGKRMNVDPQTLRRQLEAGNVAQVMQQLGGDRCSGESDAAKPSGIAKADSVPANRKNDPADDTAERLSRPLPG